MCVCVSGGGGGAGLGTGGAGEAKESPLPPLCIAEGGASSQAALCVAWRTEPGFQVDQLSILSYHLVPVGLQASIFTSLSHSLPLKWVCYRMENELGEYLSVSASHHSVWWLVHTGSAPEVAPVVLSFGSWSGKPLRFSSLGVSGMLIFHPGPRLGVPVDGTIS